MSRVRGQSPFGPRKSGRPAAGLTPAPVRTQSWRGRAARAGSAKAEEALLSPPVGRPRLRRLDEVPELDVAGAGPEPVRPSEVGQAGCCADAGPGEDTNLSGPGCELAQAILRQTGPPRGLG